jgi:phosphoesterase RecJ-like protein
MEHLATLQLLLAAGQSQKIVITTHTNPDGDAIGASLGLYHFLTELGHQVLAMVPNNLPDFVDWLVGYERLMVYEQQRELCERHLREAQVIFALDYNAPHRSEGIGNAIVDNSQAYKVMIDHHLAPADFTQARHWRTSASSASELVYEFIRMLAPAQTPSLASLNALYVGILTDTGGFRYATSATLFKTVAEFLEFGVDNNLISDRVFNSFTIARFKIQNFCLNQRLELYPELRLALLPIQESDFAAYNIEKNDLEGLVNQVLKIREIHVAILMTEKNAEEVKLSMRSKGRFSVQQICMQHFEGGGHLNAAGGLSRLSLGATKEKIKTLVAEQWQTLQSHD